MNSEHHCSLPTSAQLISVLPLLKVTSTCITDSTTVARWPFCSCAEDQEAASATCAVDGRRMSSTRRQRRQSRRLERRYRRTQSVADRQALVQQERTRHQVYRQRVSVYWSAEITSQAGLSKRLWRTFKSILGARSEWKFTKEPPVRSTIFRFLQWEGWGGSSFDSRWHCSVDAVSGWCVIQHVRALHHRRRQTNNHVSIRASSKSCALDPLPSTFMKEFLPELLPYLTDLRNSSLMQGCLPISQRHAIILPRLKKVGADSADVKNYNPIFNLTFMSKLKSSWKTGLSAINSFFDSHQLLPELQSAYRKHHSTETAVLKIVSDILQTADSGKVTLLGLLDMSAAFDTVDQPCYSSWPPSHVVWYQWYSHVLDWILHHWHDQGSPYQRRPIHYFSCYLRCPTRQRTIGPLLFLLYTADVLKIVQHHGHQHLPSYRCQTASQCAAQLSCVTADINKWMSSNPLRLNADKTQATYCTAPQLAFASK